jgi:hypothetical protein
VLFKLKKVKRFLKRWGFNLAGSRKKKKKGNHGEVGCYGELGGNVPS